jgi:hypothetical protein
VEELADRLTDYGEVARGGCLVAGYFSVKTSTVLKEEQRRARPNMKRCCISDWPLSHRLNMPPVTNRALYCNGETHAFETPYPAAAAATELNTLQ